MTLTHRKHALVALKRLAMVAVTVGSAVLAGCASQVANPVLYVLRSEPPAGWVAPLAREGNKAQVPWQLVLPVRVPDYLDREALLLPQGAYSVQASQNQRWAELLSSSVPRLLTQDLQALGGAGSVWAGTMPRGMVVRGQLRVELLALDADATGRSVTLKARWTTTGADGAAQANAHTVTLTVPSQGADTDALVGAHRLALWQLAQAIVKNLQ